MSYNADELLVLAEDFEKMATESLVKTAKAKDKKDKAKGKKLPPWLKEKDKDSKEDCADAKDGKKKLPFWMVNKDLKDPKDSKKKTK